MTDLDPAMSQEWAELKANVLDHDDYQGDLCRLFSHDGGELVGSGGEMIKVCQQIPASFTPKQKVKWDKKGTKHQTALKVCQNGSDV